MGGIQIYFPTCVILYVDLVFLPISTFLSFAFILCYLEFYLDLCYLNFLFWGEGRCITDINELISHYGRETASRCLNVFPQRTVQAMISDSPLRQDAIAWDVCPKKPALVSSILPSQGRGNAE